MRTAPRFCVAVTMALVLTIGFFASAMVDRCLMAGSDCCPEGPALIAVDGGCACMALGGPALQDSQETSRFVAQLAPAVTPALPPAPFEMSLAVGPSSVDAPHPPGKPLANPVRLRTLRI